MGNKDEKWSVWISHHLSRGVACFITETASGLGSNSKYSAPARASREI